MHRQEPKSALPTHSWRDGVPMVELKKPTLEELKASCQPCESLNVVDNIDVNETCKQFNRKKKKEKR